MSLNYNQVKTDANKLDGEVSSIAAYMQTSDDKTTFAPIYLSLLELDTRRCHLDFKVLDENLNYSKETLFTALK